MHIYRFILIKTGISNSGDQILIIFTGNKAFVMKTQRDDLETVLGTVLEAILAGVLLAVTFFSYIVAGAIMGIGFIIKVSKSLLNHSGTENEMSRPTMNQAPAERIRMRYSQKEKALKH
jgi:hypothetical protein